MPWDNLRLSSSFRDELDLGIELPSRLLFRDLEIEGLLIAKTTGLYVPPQVNFGATYIHKEIHRFSLDTTIAMYSFAPSPSVDIYFKLKGDDLERIGLGNAFHLPRDCQEKLRDDGFYDVKCSESKVKLGGEDIFIPKASYEFLPPMGFRYRLGYAFRPRALPMPKNYANYIDTQSHSFSGSIGYGYEDPFAIFSDIVHVELGMRFLYQVPIKVNKVVENPPDPIGNYKASGLVYIVSLGLETSL